MARAGEIFSIFDRKLFHASLLAILTGIALGVLLGRIALLNRFAWVRSSTRPHVCRYYSTRYHLVWGA